jgi:hypothetical protein
LSQLWKNLFIQQKVYLHYFTAYLLNLMAEWCS